MAVRAWQTTPSLTSGPAGQGNCISAADKQRTRGCMHPEQGARKCVCRCRQGTVSQPCCLQVIIQQASGISSIDQLSVSVSNTRIEVQLVSPASLLHYSMQSCTWRSSCPCCLSPSGISFSQFHLGIGSCCCIRALLCACCHTLGHLHRCQD